MAEQESDEAIIAKELEEVKSTIVEKQEASVGVRAIANDVTEAVSSLGSSLQKTEPVKLDELTRDLSKIVDGFSALPKELRHEINSTKDAFVQGIPKASQVRSAIYEAEVSSSIVQSPMFYGLFEPPPRWPQRPMNVRTLLHIATIPVALSGVAMLFTAFLIGLLLCTLPLLAPLLVPLLAPLLYLARRRRDDARQKRLSRRMRDETAAASLDRQPWQQDPAAYFSTATEASRKRRRLVAESILGGIASRSINGQLSTFNNYAQRVTSLAVYGCGVVAATHVGALRALEQHGLDYDRIHTYAGVSAGSIVVAMLAVGARAEQLHELILAIDFTKIIRPEMGSLLRAGVNILVTLWKMVNGITGAKRHPSILMDRGHGPGVNTGAYLEREIHRALHNQCGNGDITMGEVREIYGKRLVFITTELDSGKERRLTPESEPGLPVKVAVRMSMGIPGVFEPFAFEGHLYADGGMINDFPMKALPEGPGRLGLCVKQKAYVAYHLPQVEAIASASALESAPSVRSELEAMGDELWHRGVYPTRDLTDFATTCVNIMMDANLDLQIEGALQQVKPVSLSSLLGRGSHAPEVRDRSNEQKRSIFNLAPQILTLCSGGLQPFDFDMRPEEHHELYLLGQLFTHLHASQVDEEESLASIMTDEDKLKTLLLMLHLDKS